MDDSEIFNYLEERKQLTLDVVQIREKQIFTELIDSGLSETEIYEIIESWRKGSPKDKKRGLFVIQGIAACLHTFQLLVNTAKQETIEERITFDATLVEMGGILIFLSRAGILAQGKDTRKSVASLIGEYRNKLQKSKITEEDFKRRQTSKAREEKLTESEKSKNKIIHAYKEMKKTDPKISKSRAAQKIYANKEINGGRSLDTIRNYLRNK